MASGHGFACSGCRGPSVVAKENACNCNAWRGVRRHPFNVVQPDVNPASGRDPVEAELLAPSDWKEAVKESGQGAGTAGETNEAGTME